MSGFWMMMHQLWDLQPNFIKDRVNSRSLVGHLRWLPEKAFLALTEDQARGRMIPQQVILSVNSLMIILGVTRTEAMAKLQEVTGLDPVTATRMLWDTYSPHTHVWIPFAPIGVVSAIGLWIFGRMGRRWSDMNA